MADMGQKKRSFKTQLQALIDNKYQKKFFWVQNDSNQRQTIKIVGSLREIVAHI